MTNRSRIIVAVLAVLVVVAGGLFAMRMMAPPPDDLDLAREKPSANGLYSVQIAPEAEPLQQGALHNWIITISTPDGVPVADAAITVDGGMPQHGHGLPTAPQVTGAIGEGRYRLEGMRFNMGGWWVMRVTISAAAGQDTAEFNIVM